MKTNCNRIIKVIVSILFAFTLCFAFEIVVNADNETIAPEEWNDTGEATEISNGYYYPVNANHTAIECGSDGYDEFFSDYTDYTSYYYEFYVGSNAGDTRNIYAVESGTVELYGNEIYLTTKDDYRYTYLLGYDTGTIFSVTDGAYVEAGEVIGSFHFNTNEYDENYLKFAMEDLSDYGVLITWEDMFGVEEGNNFGEDINKRKWWNDYWTEQSKGEWGEISESLKQIADGSDEDIIQSIAQAFITAVSDMANEQWNSISDKLQDNSLYESENLRAYANMILIILYPVVYCFVLIFWVLEVIRVTSEEQGDMYTKRVAGKLIGGFVLSYWWISHSIQLTMMIIKFNTKIVKLLLGDEGIEWGITVAGTDMKYDGSSDWWVVRMFQELAYYFNKSIFVVAILLVIFIVVVVIKIKLIIRQFELLCLLIFAPMFYGCLVGEVTKPYFKRYLKTVVEVTVETLYMAVMYIMGQALYNEMMKDTSFEFGDASSVLQLLVLVAIGVAMVRPPQSFKEMLPNV